MNEDTIRDIYYVEHKWNPHFFYLSPKSFCQDLEKNGSDLYLDLFHAMYQEESDYICPYTENDFSLRKKLCNNGTTIIYQLITPSPVLSPLTRCAYFCCHLDKQQYFYYTCRCNTFPRPSRWLCLEQRSTCFWRNGCRQQQFRLCQARNLSRHRK